jgi:integrase
LIDHAPRVGMIKLERPEFVCWDLEQYARMLDAAVEEGDEWYVAACLAGEAGLRGLHVLRHSFGTHAAMFGVNPWKLMTWMGHKRIDETHPRDARRAWHCNDTGTDREKRSGGAAGG